MVNSEKTCYELIFFAISNHSEKLPSLTTVRGLIFSEVSTVEPGFPQSSQWSQSPNGEEFLRENYCGLQNGGKKPWSTGGFCLSSGEHGGWEWDRRARMGVQ